MPGEDLNKYLVESAELILHLINIVSSIAVGILEDRDVDEVVDMFKQSYNILREYFRNLKKEVKVMICEHD